MNSNNQLYSSPISRYTHRWYEDLQCAEVDDIIDARLKRGEQLSLPYGKLMERLLTIKMIREEIPQRPGYGWSYKQNKKDENTINKAKFIHRLIPLAEKNLKNIR